jgi:16S rRNA (guanine1516-N2)-methyltransferase
LNTFSIVVESAEFQKKANELSRSLNIPVVQLPTTTFFFIVGEKLSLKLNALEAPGPMALDFAGGALDYRRRFGHSGGHLILKAIGGGKKKVLDLTAGLCRDAFILASSEIQVKAIEKSPFISALVLDAIERARSDEKTKKIIMNLNFIKGDSEKILEEITSKDFDAIYMDPMFPTNDKSALPKKELRIVQRLLGSVSENETEAKKLFHSAREKTNRLVVKRPIHGVALYENPTIVFKGSSVRFDVYI